MRRPIILTHRQQLISRDELDTCANFAKTTQGGQVEIETVRRFGKPSVRVVSVERFTELYNANEI